MRKATSRLDGAETEWRKAIRRLDGAETRLRKAISRLDGAETGLRKAHEFSRKMKFFHKLSMKKVSKWKIS